jgi:nucleoside-diphosphate-sugar epimerase
MCPTRSEIVYIPYTRVFGQGIEDTLHREPAIEKIGSAIGWQPTIALDRIIADVVEHTRRRAEPAAELEPI